MTSCYVITPGSQLTEEDLAIINSQNPDIIGRMLVDSTYDAILFGQAEWNRKWAAESMYAMEHIY